MSPAGGPAAERPRIKSGYRLFVVEPEGVFFASDDDVVALRGELFCWLAPRLDGRTSRGELEACGDGRIGPLDVDFGLRTLMERGLLADGDPEEPAPERLARDGLGIGRQAFGEGLRSLAVRVLDLGSVDGSPLRRRLRELGVRCQEDADLTVALVDDYLDPELGELDRQMRESGRSWMPVRPRGPVVWIGPLLSPGRTACWHCLAISLRRNRPVTRLLERKIGAVCHRPEAREPFAAGAGYDLAFAQTVRWLAGDRDPEAEETLVTLDLLRPQVIRHPVRRLANCSACGQAGARGGGSAPIELGPRRVAFFADGGFRSEPPAVTWLRLQGVISPLTGVVKTLERRPFPPGVPVHVYVATHSSPGVYESWEALAGRLKMAAAGKGTTFEQARVSAVAEAIERTAGIFRGDEPRQTASLAGLGAVAIHPNACMLFSERQYAASAGGDGGAAGNRAPRPFDPGREIEWTPVWSLTAEALRYLPTALCYYDYPPSLQPGSCRADSNGNAAGSCLEEAILQGLLELVERDAVALWWYNRARRPAPGWDIPSRAALAEVLAAIGRSLRVLDLSTDLGIPCVAALSRPAGSAPGDLLMGFGAHPSAELALGRALSELGQFLPGEGSGRSWTPRPPHPDPGAAAEWLEPVPAVAAAAPGGPGPDVDLRDLVAALVERLRVRGIEVLVLDQSRPELPLKVVKVFAPGLRPWWARFAPGRLYETPVELGWLPRRRRERDLNPLPLFT